MSTPQLSAGSVVDGSYTVGTMLRMRPGASTYDATDGNGRPVLVTVYDPACFPSTLVLERCLRELRQLQAIASSRIVQVLACGKHGDGMYEVNEPVPAHTLEDHLQGGALSSQDAGAIIVQVGEALLEAQRVGLVHRNLGANVVYPSPEGVKLTGFAVGEPHGSHGFGPANTIAPEQVEGKVVDQRTLIYNLAALMHWMMSGRPLFEGDPAAVLHHHLHTDPPADVHGSLVRALGKDPRMRPMILKQFLVELAAVGGVQPPRVPSGPIPKARASVPQPAAPQPAAPQPAAAKPQTPAPAKPSTRGWTMFMEAQEDDVGASASQPAPAQPAAAAPASAPAQPVQPAAPAPAGPAKPSTRGWTMFMEAQEGEATTAEAAPAEPVPPAAAPAKPSTRGWTMFMEDEDAAPPSESPAEVAPAEPVQPAAPAKPSTRGWTMFMEAESAESPPAEPTPEPVQPTAAPTPAAQPVQPAAPAKPSTRGWTMFMEAQDEAAPAAEAAEAAPVAAAPVAAAPVAAAPAAAAPAAAAPAAAAPAAAAPAAAAPSSRGWTMFMEPGGEAPPPTASGAPEVAPAAAMAEPEAATAESDAPGSNKRGWTMFMDAPLSATPKADLGPATPDVPVDGASDNKGWTVFGAPALDEAASAPTAEVPAAGTPARGPSGRGQTVVAEGFQPFARPDAAAQAPSTDNGAPEHVAADARRPEPVRGLTAPANQPAVFTDDSALVKAGGGSRTLLFVVAGVALAAAATLAFMFAT